MSEILQLFLDGAFSKVCPLDGSWRGLQGCCPCLGLGQPWGSVLCQPKGTKVLTEPLWSPRILGQAVKVGAAAQGCVDAGRTVRGLLWCHCEHADTLVLQNEGCGGAQPPQP